MIMGNVVEHHGSHADFDNMLRLQLLLSPLSHKVRGGPQRW
jgi:hypothetical protein